jgi:hypothetical protein
MKKHEPKTKRGHHRLVIGTAEDGSIVKFVDTNVGGYHEISIDDEPTIATTHARTFEPAVRRSHKYSALGRRGR